MNTDRSLKLTAFFRLTAVAAILLTATMLLNAQPSGGPYGPVKQSWPIPQTGGRVFYVAPDGNREAAAATIAHPTTIEAAIEKVVTGDVIIMRGGTYRTGNLILNQGITIQPYGDEQPVLKGTYVADKWMDLRNANNMLCHFGLQLLHNQPGGITGV